MLVIHSFLALLIDSSGIAAGVLVNTFLDIERINWITLIYGSLLAARGDIGILAGKLSTALHMGTIKPVIKDNTPLFKNILVSILTIITVDALAIGCLTYCSNLVLFPKEIRVLNPALFFVIPLIVLYTTTLFSIVITTILSFTLFRRNLNLDLFIVPLTNSINNIIMTVFYFGLVTLLKPWGKVVQDHPLYGEFYPAPENADLLYTYLAFIPILIALGLIMYFTAKRFSDKSFTKIIKEATPMILLGMVFGLVSGVLLTQLEPVLLRYPQLWIALPALLVLMEDQSTMTGNSLTTRFAKKELQPTFKQLSSQLFG
ncbi:MAG: magnesium transporter [Candidatus Heimdallarchaeota archaeon]|nr:magnesium transporter [Candidatus Heimdallarchaeota archaeon]